MHDKHQVSKIITEKIAGKQHWDYGFQRRLIQKKDTYDHG